MSVNGNKLLVYSLNKAGTYPEGDDSPLHGATLDVSKKPQFKFYFFLLEVEGNQRGNRNLLQAQTLKIKKPKTNCPNVSQKAIGCHIVNMTLKPWCSDL